MTQKVWCSSLIISFTMKDRQDINLFDSQIDQAMGNIYIFIYKIYMHTSIYIYSISRVASWVFISSICNWLY